MGRLDDLDPLVGRLAARYRVIRYDARGHGRWPPEWGITRGRRRTRTSRSSRRDPMMAECSERIAGRIPGCRMITVPGADHLLPLRAPGRLAELITEHVR